MEQRDPLVTRPRREDRVHLRGHLAQPFEALDAGPVRVLLQFLGAQDVTELRPPLVGGEKADHEPLAVTGLEVVPRRRAFVVLPPADQAPAPHCPGDVVRLDQHLRPVQRGVHLLHLPVPFPRQQREHDRVPRNHRADVVGLREAGGHRRAVLAVAGHGHEAATRLREQVHCALVPLGPEVTPARRAGEDAVRVVLLDRLERDTQAFHHAAAHVVVEDIRRLHQAPEHLHARRVLHVDEDRALPSVQRVEVGVARPALQEAASRIWIRVRLDLDDVRTHVGEHRRRIGALLPDGQVEDSKALKRQRHGPAPLRAPLGAAPPVFCHAPPAPAPSRFRHHRG